MFHIYDLNYSKLIINSLFVQLTGSIDSNITWIVGTIYNIPIAVDIRQGITGIVGIGWSTSYRSGIFTILHIVTLITFQRIGYLKKLREHTHFFLISRYTFFKA